MRKAIICLLVLSKSEGQAVLGRTTITLNSLAHRTTWLRSDFRGYDSCCGEGALNVSCEMRIKLDQSDNI